MSLGPFDYVNAVTYSKQHLSTDDGEYVPFLTNRSLSYHLDALFYAQDMNLYHELPKQLQYDFFLHTLSPRKRFAKWVKTFTGDELKAVQDLFQYNSQKAAEALAILSDEDKQILLSISEVTGDKGGRK